MKSAKDFLEEAHAVVDKMAASDAIKKHGSDNAVFIDVRDSGDVSETGTIKDAVRIPRGFLEFAADDGTQFHNPALTKDADIYLVCAAGGQAALSGKTLKDMGYKSVTNIGGISDWKDAGGPMD